jgi:SAM-dependent methyltransferase
MSRVHSSKEAAMTETQALNRVESDPWGARAHDWAEIEDVNSRPLFEAILTATNVGDGTAYLDVGCGSGLAAGLAVGRGARAHGVDASPGMIACAQERFPDADFRVADMQALPFSDETFDVVSLINTLFFAPDHAQAMEGAARVTRRGGRVAVVTWPEPARVDLTAYVEAVAPLLSDAPDLDPFIPVGELERLAAGAGLEVARVLALEWSWSYPDLETMLRGLLSPGLSTLAIEHVGEEPVREALANGLAHLRLTDGSYRIENEVHCLVASR